MESGRRQDGTSNPRTTRADGVGASDRALKNRLMTNSFVGEWIVTRSITDLQRSTTIACSGSATLRRDGAELAYDEVVSFYADGKLIRGTRAYRYSVVRGEIVAMFDDGSPFFSLRLNAHGEGSASHRCGEDLYELALCLRPDAWTTVWEVSGTKRLRITTDYKKAVVRTAAAQPLPQ